MLTYVSFVFNQHMLNDKATEFHSLTSVQEQHASSPLMSYKYTHQNHNNHTCLHKPEIHLTIHFYSRMHVCPLVSENI